MRTVLIIGVLIAMGLQLSSVVEAQVERHRPTPITIGALEGQMQYAIAACGNQVGPTVTLASSPVIWGPARIATFERCAIMEVHGILYSLPHFGPTVIQS